jgi:hypothetical protein
MVAVTFEAVSYLDALRRAADIGLCGDIVPVSRGLWICVAI